MSRLVILWLLSEGPLHGYRIKKILDEPSLRFWFPIEIGSIYAVLNSLARGGFIESEAVEREGLRPERTRYKITKSGRAHFQELLRQAWREPPKLADPINLCLSARSELAEDEINGLLTERARSVRELREDVKIATSSAPAAEMVSRRQKQLDAELEWLESLLKDKGD